MGSFFGPDRGGKQRLSIAGIAAGRLVRELPVALDWTVLEFSNTAFPNEFMAAFSELGTGWGEWSAIALAD